MLNINISYSSGESFSSRGIYFAETSVYSHHFAFKPANHLIRGMTSWNERPNSRSDEFEIFRVKLLVGQASTIPESHALTMPPLNPANGLRYDTLKGSRNGSPIWIVYENGRAYPDYLVRYYRGSYDPTRTPFRNHMEATGQYQDLLQPWDGDLQNDMSPSIVGDLDSSRHDEKCTVMLDDETEIDSQNSEGWSFHESFV
jgi:hypothetical protein